jgi:hypothetical protein
MPKKIPDLESNEFYSNPSGITSQETFLAIRYIQKMARNPIFEAISFQVPPRLTLNRKNNSMIPSSSNMSIGNGRYM